MSWKVEVIADDTGEWVTNAVCFATEEEAMANGRDLIYRWTAVRRIRITKSDEPVNYTFKNGKLEKIELSPYAHELNHSGTACAEDCPACEWAKKERCA